MILPYFHMKTAARSLLQSIRLRSRICNVIRKSEEKLAEKIDELMEAALNTTEVIEIQSKERIAEAYSPSCVSQKCLLPL